MSDDKKMDEIDYLHPDGKPEKAKKLKTEEEFAMADQSVQKSIAEADGHHMCSSECQQHHDV